MRFHSSWHANLVTPAKSVFQRVPARSSICSARFHPARTSGNVSRNARVMTMKFATTKVFVYLRVQSTQTVQLKRSATKRDSASRYAAKIPIVPLVMSVRPEGVERVRGSAPSSHRVESLHWF